MSRPKSNFAMDTMSFALERTVHFLSEERTDRPVTKNWQSQFVGLPFTDQPYILYGEVVPQMKNVLGAKKPAGQPRLAGGDMMAGAEAIS